jgi:hypothetical protein
MQELRAMTLPPTTHPFLRSLLIDFHPMVPLRAAMEVLYYLLRDGRARYIHLLHPRLPRLWHHLRHRLASHLTFRLYVCKRASNVPRTLIAAVLLQSVFKLVLLGSFSLLMQVLMTLLEINSELLSESYSVLG